MTVNLSPIAGAAWQFFSDAGLPLTGGKLYTYAAGTTTPLATYTSVSGLIANSNPIILNAAGRSASEVWLTSDTSYKFVLKTSSDVTIGTYDDIAVADPNVLAYLASTSSNALGDALVGFKQSNSSGFLTGATARTVNDKLQESVSVKDFGATGNGSTNDRAAFVSADTNGAFVVPAGTYLISSSLTIASSVTMMPGAILSIPTGVTVTFSNTLSAGIYKIFDCTGTGAVAFNQSKTSTGYPEWWGAIVNVTDCFSTITAALTALNDVVLQPGTYYSSATIKINRDWSCLRGAGAEYNATDNQITRLLVISSSLDALQIGPDTYPGNINSLQRGNHIRGLYVARNVNPLAGSGCMAIKIQYTYRFQAEDVKTEQSEYGWYFYGNIQPQLTQCYAFRSTLGSGGGTQIWRGYYIQGSSGLFAGGNASVYLTRCTAGVAALTMSVKDGLYADNNFTDLYIDAFETVSCNVGMNIQGNGATGADNGNRDLLITNCVNDAFSQYGILLNNVNQAGAVTITSGYNGPASGAIAAIGVTNCSGSIAINGGQLVMNSGNATGIQVDNSSNVNINAVQIVECSGRAVAGNTAVNCTFNPIVTNYGVSTLGVCEFTAVTRSRFAPSFTGMASGTAYGVRLLGAANGYNEINCSGMNPAAIAGGSANKLEINGVQITVTGLTGTNLASGIMN
jgi:hypothetical protein